MTPIMTNKLANINIDHEVFCDTSAKHKESDEKLLVSNVKITNHTAVIDGANIKKLRILYVLNFPFVSSGEVHEQFATHW